MIGGALATWLSKFSWSAGRLGAVSRTFGCAVADGSVPSLERLFLHGYDVGASGSEKSNYPGNAIYPWQTADQTLKVISSSADDDGDPAGIGAQTIRIWWLNAAGVEATEDVIMDGVTIVATGVVTARRVNKVAVLTSGTSGPNVGEITVYNTGGVGGSKLAVIRAGWGTSSGTIQTVPAGKCDWITDVMCQWNYYTTGTSYRLYSRTSPTAPWVSRASFYHECPVRHFDYPIKMEAGTDYHMVSYKTSTQFAGVTLEGFRETT